MKADRKAMTGYQEGLAKGLEQGIEQARQQQAPLHARMQQLVSEFQHTRMRWTA